MKFDLTPHIKLTGKDLEKYSRGRFLVFLSAFALATFLFFAIFFPSTYFIFSFENPESSKNSIGIPRNNSQAQIEGDTVNEDSTIIFDAVKTGNYSKARLSLTFSENSDDLEGSEVVLRKSFQSFFYPEEEPLGFSDGMLVENSGEYFIVSKGTLRRFGSLFEVEKMGFSKNAFWKVDENDLKHSPKGEIVSTEAFPDGSTFRIEDSYYFLTDGKLQEFVSQKAYLTRFDESMAIPKDESFLKNYEIPEEEIGFADGTLVSYGISAFVISSGKIWPINNPETFLSSGYRWEDLLPISGDEYSLYEKEKLFTISSPHPDGTIFETLENEKYFLIKNQRKHLLPSKKVALSYSKSAPIKVSEKSLETFEKCELRTSPFSSEEYFCELPLARFSGLTGKDYEFQFTPKNEVDLDTLEVTLSKAATFSNFKSALSEMVEKIITNYAGKI